MDDRIERSPSNARAGSKGFAAIPIEDRLWPRVNKDAPGGCWIWQGNVNNHGYGRITFEGRVQLVHRVAFRLNGGEILEGHVLDHLCRRPACVNPDHLESVSQRENDLRGVSPFAVNARKTRCPQGHEYSAANTRFHVGREGRTHRICKTCASARSAQQWAERKRR